MVVIAAVAFVEVVVAAAVEETPWVAVVSAVFLLAYHEWVALSQAQFWALELLGQLQIWPHPWHWEVSGQDPCLLCF